MSNRRRKKCQRAARARNYHDFSETMQEGQSLSIQENQSVSIRQDNFVDRQEENEDGQGIRSVVSRQDDFVVDNQSDAVVAQAATQVSLLDQESDEIIWIIDSCNVVVETTDTQAAVSLQVGLQLAIALVLSLTIGDSDRGQILAQEIFQEFDSEQTYRQQILIENSKDVNIITTDTDLTITIQAMLQVLLALVVNLDVL